MMQSIDVLFMIYFVMPFIFLFCFVLFCFVFFTVLELR